MNKIIRRASAMILAASLTVSLTACGRDVTSNNDRLNSASRSESALQTAGAKADNTEADNAKEDNTKTDNAKADNKKSDNANPGNQKADDGDLPYWNGFDFGPNLQYAEEYKLQSDPGDYMNAYEAAKYTFDTARNFDSIPEYSDDTEYTMVLVGLETIEGDECYVYRLDVDEPTGTVGASYAYAYQSGNIYMQGNGGQYVMIMTPKKAIFPEVE